MSPSDGRGARSGLSPAASPAASACGGSSADVLELDESELLEDDLGEAGSSLTTCAACTRAGS